MEPLPPAYVPTREALRALACYVLAPARKARTGRIGLTPVGDGFGTPPFDDGSRLAVSGAELVREPGGRIPLTTLADAARFAGVGLDPDPGVGHDLPPFQPDADLAVDAGASRALGAWYGFGARVLADLRGGVGDRARLSPDTLWPEHFDLATTLEDDRGRRFNVGASPGDADRPEPYLYFGPWERSEVGDDPFWDAPFGAALDHRRLRAASDPGAAAAAFLDRALGLVGL